MAECKQYILMYTIYVYKYYAEFLYLKAQTGDLKAWPQPST